MSITQGNKTTGTRTKSSRILLKQMIIKNKPAANTPKWINVLTTIITLRNIRPNNPVLTCLMM